ncbi:hypothetical protein ACIRPK_07190 [Kitasatospora sp. NPDC101801]
MEHLFGALLSGLMSIVRLFRKRPSGPYSPDADNYGQPGAFL